MSSNACSNSEATHWHGGLQGAGGCAGWWRSGRLDKPPQPPPTSSSLNIRLIPWSTIRSVMPQAEPVAAVPTDAALIAAWQGGDEQAAAEVVRRHARALARFLSGAGALEADLDDLVQETFIRAFRAVGRFRGQCRFRTWLLTIGGKRVKGAALRGKRAPPRPPGRARPPTTGT